MKYGQAYYGFTMQSLSDDEMKQVLGEVLSDQLQAILEYVQEIPGIKMDIDYLKVKVDEIDNRLIIVEALVREHETDIRELKQALI